MRENHLLNEGELLNEKGDLAEAGYSYSLIKNYDRTKIKKRKSRIKEWDYYYFGDDEYGIALTIDDNGYMGLVSASLLDFNKKSYINKADIFWFCFGKVNLPTDSTSGVSEHISKNHNFRFEVKGELRIIKAYFKNFQKGKSLSINAILKPTTKKSMVIATPFKKKAHFYYNQKINNLEVVEGKFEFGDFSYFFKPHTYGVLDWGRGVWTYKNTWYWSSLNSYQDGKTIGFNLGYGFGDTSKASENMVFVNDEVLKLDDVVFDIPKVNNKEDYLSSWRIYSSDHILDLTFDPILDRHDCTNALIISQDAHQVFGKFSGTIRFKGEELTINGLIGFAEKVKNKW